MPLDKPEDVLTLFAGETPPLFTGHQPMPAPCKDCPFVMADKGMDYLGEGRLDGIKMATLLGQPFHCHKSVYSKAVDAQTTVDDETGEERRPSYSRHYRQCAGATLWAKDFLREHGHEPKILGVDVVRRTEP